ncbi:MAG: ornithine carbamoyltransferase [Victivallales bacterium]|jgi:ornithine carbamoyltransferase
MQSDLLTVEEMTLSDLKELFKLSAKMKRERGKCKAKPLAGKSVGMIFAKSSTRTRVSFEVGIRELGGFSIFLDQNDLQLGRGETIADTAKVLSRYLHAVIIRTFSHEDVIEFAKFANIPVINALTDKFHPCQILTDLFTIYEYSERVEGVKIAYLGDCASNVANSLIIAAKRAGMNLVLSSPKQYRPDKDIMLDSNIGKGVATWEEDPFKAVENADYIYTDVWVSMGFESESKQRLKLLKPYSVTADIVDAASPNVRIMHCLPAHRGEEISAEVIDSHASIVFDQAENRLHVQKAILTMLMKED